MLASAVEIEPETQNKTFIVEHVQKVQDWQSLKASLDHEWRTVLVSNMKDDIEQCIAEENRAQGPGGEEVEAHGV